MLERERNKYMSICNRCNYRQSSGEVTNRYGVGRCLAYFCTNPDMEGKAHSIYEELKTEDDDKEWDMVNYD